jgi:hypothetical protein
MGKRLRDSGDSLMNKEASSKGRSERPTPIGNGERETGN